METVYKFIGSITPDGFSAQRYLMFLAVLVLGVVLISVVARLIFGKRSTLNHAVSSAIAILFIYAVNVVIYSTGARLEQILSPLPFVAISGDYLVIYDVLGADFRSICAMVLDMLILAFLMNLLDSWLPRGKKLLSWYFFRFMSVVLAICLQFVLNLLFDAILPAGFAQHAPMILLIVLLTAFALGALKLLIGGALAFISPLLGIFYAFFFSHTVGKQLSKAMLTTVLLTGLVCLLNYLGVTAVFIASAALAAYIPLLIVILVLWYIVAHLL